MNPYNSIPQEDRYVMQEAYLQGNRLPGQNPEDVVHKIGWRIYTEFCLNTDWSEHDNYDGQAYRKWIDDEIHYAFERQHQHGQRPQEYKEREYACMRESVLRAVVARATELFLDWNGGTTPCLSPEHPTVPDQRNLRANLEEYMRGNRMEKAA